MVHLVIRPRVSASPEVLKSPGLSWQPSHVIVTCAAPDQKSALFT